PPWVEPCPTFLSPKPPTFPMANAAPSVTMRRSPSGKSAVLATKMSGMARPMVASRGLYSPCRRSRKWRAFAPAEARVAFLRIVGPRVLAQVRRRQFGTAHDLDHAARLRCRHSRAGGFRQGHDRHGSADRRRRSARPDDDAVAGGRDPDRAVAGHQYLAGACRRPLPLGGGAALADAHRHLYRHVG